MIRLRMAKLARFARIVVALAILIAASYGFLAAGKVADSLSGIVASWQLAPAIDRAIGSGIAGLTLGGCLSCVMAVALLVLSALLGRWYCSALCPLGTLQDLASLAKGRKRSFRKPQHPLRISVMAIFAVFIAAGATNLASWVEPWSLFGRLFAHDLEPLLRSARHEDSPELNWIAIAAPAVAVLAILVGSFFSGRWFCGNACPVGSVLGALNAIAPFRVRLDPDACVSCGACAAVCRASCIDAREKRLDSTRCVNCLACIGSCPKKALGYWPSRKNRELDFKKHPEKSAKKENENGISRSQFLAAAGSGLAAISLLVFPVSAHAATVAIGNRKEDPPSTPVLPPGARSRGLFLSTCLACGLCIDRCPSKVLQPALGQLGLRGFMVPRLDHSISYCQFDCKACIDVCPSGALEKLGIERKRLAKIGDATLVRSRCVVFTQGTKCGACAEHCPTGAVRMVVGKTGLPEPVFTSSICIGCGACHHACPVRPDRAISVSGLEVQGLAQAPSPSLFDNQQDKPPVSAGKASMDEKAGNEFPF